MPPPYRAAGILMPYNDVPHLFAVMNEPRTDGLCLTLMVTSVKPNRPHDPTCILNTGDHSWLTHESYILYRTVNQTRIAHLDNMLARGYYTFDSYFPEHSFARIAAGISASDDTPGSMIRYARGLGF